MVSQAFGLAAVAEEAGFVHPDVLPALTESFPNAQQLYRLPQLSWAKDWHGWGEVRGFLDECDDVAVKTCILDDFVKRFAEVCQAQIVLNFPSDLTRRSNLERQGFVIGRASGIGFNCLIDSLLQLLVHYKVVACRPRDTPLRFGDRKCATMSEII